ncbi:MAG: PadR family transcriptional regulator [Candidatus Bathyarchaeota archaeon]
MSIKRLISKVTKENLWLYILTELSTRSMYAYEIAKVLKEKYQIPVATVTTYIVLYKMEREGLIKKRDSEGMFRRKYYIITEKGFLALDNGKKFLNKIIKMLEKKDTEH